MTKSEIVHKIEACIPDTILKIYRNTKQKSKRYIRWKHQQIAYSTAISRVRQKESPLNVVFIVSDSSEWKYDSLYLLMDKDSYFNPTILVCPMIVYYTEEQAYDIFSRTYEFFLKRGYKVSKACENVYDDSINVEAFSPDIIFYSCMWTQYMHPKYDHMHLRRYLKCYIDYGYCSIVDEWGYSSPFHGLMWRYYTECEDLRELALKAQPRELRNAVVTGYPIFDEYREARGNTTDWKNQDRNFKRVIWAPHHTIEGRDNLLRFSTFLEVADFMLDYALKQKTIQFAFKPHPMLLQALYSHPHWGKEKADAYYKKWEEGDNTSLVTGAYIDLFKSSDAMIHDCGSFIVEYLYTQKPVMYLGDGREEQSNIVGIKAYRCHYHGNKKDDIKQFVENVVLKENDTMKEIRKAFYNEVLLPPNGCSVAENIINDIKHELQK